MRENEYSESKQYQIKAGFKTGIPKKRPPFMSRVFQKVSESLNIGISRFSTYFLVISFFSFLGLDAKGLAEGVTEVLHGEISGFGKIASSFQFQSYFLEEGNPYRDKFISIGGGKFLLEEPIKIKDLEPEECGSLCETNASFVSLKEAGSICSNLFDGRVPTYKELDSGVDTYNPFVWFFVDANKKHPELTSTYHHEDDDYHKVFFKNKKQKAFYEIKKTQYSGYIDLDEAEKSEYNFRCVIDGKKL